MAVKDEKTTRKIKLVKGTENGIDADGGEWGLEPPREDEIDSLLDDLDDVLSLTEEISDRSKVKGKVPRLTPYGPSVPRTEKDLKEALQAMSTPVGEAPRVLGGSSFASASYVEETRKHFLPETDASPKHGLARKILLFVAVPYLILMVATYFIVSSASKSLVSNLSGKLYQHELEWKKSETALALGYLVGILGSENTNKKVEEDKFTRAGFKRIVRNFEGPWGKRGIYVLCPKKPDGKLNLTRAIVVTGHRVSGDPNVVGSPHEVLPKLATSLCDPGKNSVGGNVSHVGWVKDSDGVTFAVGFRDVPNSPYVIGIISPVQGIGAEPLGAEKQFFQKEMYKLLGIEATGLLIIFLLLLLYSRHVHKTVKKIGHHIDLMALGDFEQGIDTKSSDEFGFLARKLSRMQTSVSAAISRLRRRRNV